MKQNLRIISHPLDRELLVGCPVLLQVTKPQRAPLLQLSERCSCTKRVQRSGQGNQASPPIFLHLLSCCSLDRLTEVVLNRLHRAQIPLTAWARPAGTPTSHFVNQTRFVSFVEEFHLDASVMLLTWTSQPSPQGRCLTDHWRNKSSSKEYCESLSLWQLWNYTSTI